MPFWSRQKGSPAYWVAVVKPGRVLFEVAGVSKDLAKEALCLASCKLPCKTREALLSRYEELIE